MTEIFNQLNWSLFLLTLFAAMGFRMWFHDVPVTHKEIPIRVVINVLVNKLAGVIIICTVIHLFYGVIIK